MPALRRRSRAVPVWALAAALCTAYSQKERPGGLRSDGSTGPVFMAQRLPAEPGPRAEPAALRCCHSSGDPHLLLGCGDAPGDLIEGIDYAFFGNTSGGSVTCGREADAKCGSRVEKVVASACVGRPSCLLNLLDLHGQGMGCPGTHAQSIAVRWRCSSALRKAESAPCRPLPPKPLRARGSTIVDASGDRVRFTGVTWGGGHIVHVPSGLDSMPVESIAKLVRRLGFNVVRLTVSVEGVLENPAVDHVRIAANPRLSGHKTMDVFDVVIDALEHEGVIVWLDIHMLDAGWCCGNTDGNGLWFNGRYTEHAWRQSLRDLAQRFGHRPNVVGIGMKNEPRATCTGQHGPQFSNVSQLFKQSGGLAQPDPYGMNPDRRECVLPQWSDGLEEFQHKLAMERAGRDVLEVNPQLLVGVSGIDYSQYLDQVASSPVHLPKESVVFEVHEYDWFRNHRRGGPFDIEKDFAGAFHNFTKELDKWWGYLLRQDVAPVFVSEFGFAHGWLAYESPRKWFQLWSSYLTEGGPAAARGGVDWAYWQLSGVQAGGIGRHAGAVESFGVLNRCFTAPYDDLHFEAIQDLGLDPPQLRTTEIANLGSAMGLAAKFAADGPASDSKGAATLLSKADSRIDRVWLVAGVAAALCMAVEFSSGSLEG